METQVLREIDKWDKVGPDGVRARLTTGTTDQSGAKIPGVGLHNCQAEMIVSFLDGRFGDGLDGMKRWFSLIPSRFKLISYLEDQQVRPGYTKFDELLDMRPNADQTWRDGGRPENIAWALDDMVAAIRQKIQQTEENT